MALYGGLGTLEEMAEILAWKQPGLISHPVGCLINTNQFFDPLLDQIRLMVEGGFTRWLFNILQVVQKPG